MKLSTQRKKETGAFYTPKVWADMAVSYLKDNLEGDLQDYIFWDCAAGEGALLEALPDNCRKIGTTLEIEDVDILKSKGIEAYPFDFFDDDLERLPFWEEVNENLDKLVIFTNPPYMTLKSTHQCFAKTKYKTNNAEWLFIYRICLEIAPKYLAIFTKAATIQNAGNAYWDTQFTDYFRAGFASCSKQDWGLAGNFGILFSLFFFDYHQLVINTHNSPLHRGEKEGLYYAYWSDNPRNKTDTRTDIENLNLYFEKFHLYRR